MLKLQRKHEKPTYTIGDLYLNEKWFSNILEPEKGKRIQAGIYKIIFVYSPLNKCIVPLLLNVPNQSKIEIHIGNKRADTKGCLLVGKNKIIGGLVESTPTFRSLMMEIQNQKDLTIEIIDEILI